MNKIPLFKIFSDDDDIKAVSDVISRGSYWAEGPEIALFENLIKEFMGVKHAIAFNSGTTALHAAMISHGIGPGDEVIVPSFSFIATANAPKFVGAVPVFADIEKETYGLCPDDVKSKITEKTKAIMPIHYAGNTCMIQELKEIADLHNLILIEDNAESMGALYNGKFAGTFGNSSMLSFCQNKIVPTGEGGAMITDDDDIALKLKLIRSHGRPDADYFNTKETPDYISLGYNFRMPALCGALGVSQMKKIDKLIAMRRELADYYNDEFSELPGVRTPGEKSGCRHVYQLYTIELKDSSLRNLLMQELAKEGILSKIYFEPIHKNKYYSSLNEGKIILPLTEEISSRVLTLPFYPGMPLHQREKISEAVKRIISRNG